MAEIDKFPPISLPFSSHDRDGISCLHRKYGALRADFILGLYGFNGLFYRGCDLQKMSWVQVKSENKIQPKPPEKIIFIQEKVAYLGKIYYNRTLG